MCPLCGRGALSQQCSAPRCGDRCGSCPHPPGVAGGLGASSVLPPPCVKLPGWEDAVAAKPAREAAEAMGIPRDVPHSATD